MENKKTEIFIGKAIKIHGQKYDYSLVDYVRAHDKIIIVCPIHGQFLQKPNTHLNGAGCAPCGIIKQKNTILEKYGVENPSQSEVIKQRKKETLLKNYGVDHNFKSDIVIEKRKQTWIDNYGVDNPLKVEEIKQKSKQTSIKRYGVDNPAKSHIVKEKIKNIFIEKYGVNCASKRHYSKEVLEKLYSYEWLYEEHHVKEKSLLSISQELNISQSSLKGYYVRNNIPVKNYGSSIGEIELQEFIKEYIECKSNDRTVIRPNELDVFIPSKNLAIEFNGIYWHSTEYKNKKYHKNKYLMCKRKGVNLIHIFEDEWYHKNEIVKNKLLRLVGINIDNNIDVSKCRILEVSDKDKSDFYDEYHIDGDSDSKINFGLYHDLELIACMSFIKNKKSTFKLVRYADKFNNLNYFHELLNYFKLNYKWNQINVECDLRWNEEHCYEGTGFVKYKTSPPDYYYIINGERVSRLNFTKDEIKEIFPEIYDNNKTVLKMMKELGVSRIYDCGKIKYKLSR